MTKGGKDSSEVVKFMTLFARLKDWSEDVPEDLAELAATDSGVKDLCKELSFAARFLKMNKRRTPALFAAPVDPAFLSAWRDYEQRYESAVTGVWLPDLLPELSAKESPRTPKADLQWDIADDEGEEQAGGIREAIEFAQFNADQEDL